MTLPCCSACRSLASFYTFELTGRLRAMPCGHEVSQIQFTEAGASDA